MLSISELSSAFLSRSSLIVVLILNALSYHIYRNNSLTWRFKCSAIDVSWLATPLFFRPPPEFFLSHVLNLELKIISRYLVFPPHRLFLLFYFFVCFVCIVCIFPRIPTVPKLWRFFGKVLKCFKFFLFFIFLFYLKIIAVNEPRWANNSSSLLAGLPSLVPSLPLSRTKFSSFAIWTWVAKNNEDENIRSLPEAWQSPESGWSPSRQLEWSLYRECRRQWCLRDHWKKVIIFLYSTKMVWQRFLTINQNLP